MNCPVCGAPNADGAGFCGACGSPLGQQDTQQYQQQPNMQYQQQPNMQYQQPNMQYQQPNMQYQQPNMQYQQPNMQQPYDPNMQQTDGNAQQSFGSRMRGMSVSPLQRVMADKLMVCIYVGYFFIFLASFLPRWVYQKYTLLGVSESEGQGLLVTGGGILKFYSILFILIVAAGVLIELNCIPAITGVVDKFKSLPFSQFYLPALAFIIWILCITNSVNRAAINMINEGKSTLGSLGLNSGYSGGYGLACWMCLIGIILLLVPPVLKLIKKENYWN